MLLVVILALAFFCVYIKGLWNTMTRQQQGSQPKELINLRYHLKYRGRRLGFVRPLTESIDILWFASWHSKLKIELNLLFHEFGQWVAWQHQWICIRAWHCVPFPKYAHRVFHLTCSEDGFNGRPRTRSMRMTYVDTGIVPSHGWYIGACADWDFNEYTCMTRLRNFLNFTFCGIFRSF